MLGQVAANSPQRGGEMVGFSDWSTDSAKIERLYEPLAPYRNSFGAWLGRSVSGNLQVFVGQMSGLVRHRFFKLLAVLVGIFLGGLLAWDDPDLRFKPVDIPFNQMYSSEWWFWLVVNTIALCCLLVGISYILSRPTNN